MARQYRPDPKNPISVAKCDISGFIVPRNELVRQMQYRGNRLVWTGFWVWNRFADIPNPQMLTPILPPDPVAVQNPPAKHDNGESWNLITLSGENIVTNNGEYIVTDQG
jgi:hypothetical protein